jgi:hypothetical protein
MRTEKRIKRKEDGKKNQEKGGRKKESRERRTVKRIKRKEDGKKNQEKGGR